MLNGPFPKKISSFDVAGHRLKITVLRVRYNKPGLTGSKYGTRKKEYLVQQEKDFYLIDLQLVKVYLSFNNSRFASTQCGHKLSACVRMD